ncbi:hypothetical protein VTI74DRAFT_3935 [Chaetomium olivicolor]
MHHHLFHTANNNLGKSNSRACQPPRGFTLLQSQPPIISRNLAPFQSGCYFVSSSNLAPEVPPSPFALPSTLYTNRYPHLYPTPNPYLQTLPVTSRSFSPFSLPNPSLPLPNLSFNSSLLERREEDIYCPYSSHYSTASTIYCSTEAVPSLGEPLTGDIPLSHGLGAPSSSSIRNRSFAASKRMSPLLVI